MPPDGDSARMGRLRTRGLALLLRVDTGDSLDLTMWGDCGIAYFWVREQDARRRDFAKVQAFVEFD